MCICTYKHICIYIERERDTHVRMRKELVHDLHDSTTAATAQDPPRFFLGWQMSAGFGMDVIAAIAIPCWGVLYPSIDL